MVTSYNMGQDYQSLKGTGLRKPKLRKLKQEADSEGSRAWGWPGPGGQSQVPGMKSQSQIKNV